MKIARYSWWIILIGTCVTLGLWFFVFQQIARDYERTRSDVAKETMNLAQAFEENVRNIVDDADRDLLAFHLLAVQTIDRRSASKGPWKKSGSIAANCMMRK